MKLLLDTHVVLWWYLDDRRVSAAARALIEDPAKVKFVSPASHWEVAIKIRIGKYILRIPFRDFVREAIFDNGFVIAPIEPRHSEILTTLVQHHKDPFDRMLVAQAMAEDMAIASADTVLDAYPIRRLW